MDKGQGRGTEEVPVHPKANQSWIFIGRTDVEAETPILWPPHAKSWLIWKDPDAGKDWGQEKKGMTEDDLVGWYHWLDGYGFGWVPGVDDRQGGLACCSSWGRKELDTTEWLNCTENFKSRIQYFSYASLGGKEVCVWGKCLTEVPQITKDNEGFGKAKW